MDDEALLPLLRLSISEPKPPKTYVDLAWEMIDEVDANGDGSLICEEFVAALRGEEPHWVTVRTYLEKQFGTANKLFHKICPKSDVMNRNLLKKYLHKEKLASEPAAQAVAMLGDAKATLTREQFAACFVDALVDEKSLWRVLVDGAVPPPLNTLNSAATLSTAAPDTPMVIGERVTAHLRSVLRLLAAVKVLQDSRKRGAREECFTKWEQAYECLVLLQDSKTFDFVELSGVDEEELPTLLQCNTWISELQLALNDNRFQQLSQTSDARAEAVIDSMLEALDAAARVRLERVVCPCAPRACSGAQSCDDVVCLCLCVCKYVSMACACAGDPGEPIGESLPLGLCNALFVGVVSCVFGRGVCMHVIGVASRLRTHPVCVRVGVRVL